MTNFGDLVGTFMRNGLPPEAGARVNSALEQLLQGGPAGNAGAVGAGGGMLGGLLGSLTQGLAGAAQHPAQAGGLGAMAGGLLGGGKGAIGGGALGMLASVALNALQSARQANGSAASSAVAAESGGLLQTQLRTLGGATPADDHRETLEQTSRLILKAMINAAKADGQVSPAEMQRIVTKLKEAGADDNAQQWVLEEMARPLDLAAFAAEITSPELAAEVYTASLLAIEVDMPAERAYLEQLARLTGLHPLVIGQIRKTLGINP